MPLLRRCSLCKRTMKLFNRVNFLFHACPTCDLTDMWPSEGYEGDTIAA